MDPDPIELSNLSKQFAYTKMASQIDSGDDREELKNIEKFIKYVFSFCALEYIYTVDKVCAMACYIRSLWCLILNNMFSCLKFKKNQEISLKFTSILSSNNVKFNDFRFQEHMSQYLNMDYFKVPYISHMLCSNIIKCDKEYVKTLSNSSSNSNTPKKQTKKEKYAEFKKKYYETDLFEFIKNNNLDNKMIEKLCKISGSDSLWTDNEIIKEFTNNIDSLLS